MYDSDIRHANFDLEKKLNQLYRLDRNKALDLSFRPPYLNLLRALGNPHEKLPAVIHVAGTNGKGSTIAMLRAMMEAANLRVHAYTSPHLVHFNERIILAGQTINDHDLEALIDEVIDLNNGQSISFFEITTAMAFAAFARVPADVVLLETGLGGRLDCTNVITHPLLTIITAIGLDHQDYLGDTLDKIAAEKAGIMKPDTPCISAKQKDAVIENVLRNKATSLGIPLYQISDVHEDKNEFSWIVNHEKSTHYPKPALTGRHQIDNAATAIAALKQLKDHFPSIDDNHISEGLTHTKWPARLQDITAHFPVNTAVWNIILDGGHNEDAAQALLQHIAMWQRQDKKPLHIICTMMRHKDAARFIAPLAVAADTVTAIPLPHEPDAFSPQDLQKSVPDVVLKRAPSFEDAVNEIMATHDAGRILICGSLYLAGHVLQTIGFKA